MYRQTLNNNFQNNVNTEYIFSKHERDKDPSSVLGYQKVVEHGNYRGHPNVVVRPEARYKGHSKSGFSRIDITMLLCKHQNKEGVIMTIHKIHN